MEDCTSCHAGAEDLSAIRMSPTDFDGDGDSSEGIGVVTAQIHERLLAAIMRYGTEVAGMPIAYAEGSYPYFFADPNADGRTDPDEASYDNRYAAWTPRLLRAAYNYQFVAKEGGAYAHNPHYTLQLSHRQPSGSDGGSARRHRRPHAPLRRAGVPVVDDGMALAWHSWRLGPLHPATKVQLLSPGQPLERLAGGRRFEASLRRSTAPYPARARLRHTTAER
jgi:hypothetical protein